jgi:hypothetical protein
LGGRDCGDRWSLRTRESRTTHRSRSQQSGSDCCGAAKRGHGIHAATQGCGVARTYAEEVFADFSQDTSVFYTNAHWDEYFASSSFAFSGLIDSTTFDGGVIVVKQGLALCIWFEDED